MYHLPVRLCSVTHIYTYSMKTLSSSYSSLGFNIHIALRWTGPRRSCDEMIHHQCVSFPKSRAKDRVKLLLSEEMNSRVGVILCTRNTNRPLAMITHSFLLYFWLRVYTLKNTEQGVLYKTNNFSFDASRVNMAYRGPFLNFNWIFSTHSRWLQKCSQVSFVSCLWSLSLPTCKSVQVVVIPEGRE